MANASSPRRLPERLRDFLAAESAGGVFMILCAAAALLLANSAWADRYVAFTHAQWREISLHFVINDGLMAIFFLQVGMELKREMLEGFLSERSQKILPLLAAAGGVIAPALIYLAFNHGSPEHVAGWAIPTATDIAFAVCVISLGGSRVPNAAKIFLLALAIYDDLAAILIIALVYSAQIGWLALAAAAAITGIMIVLNRRGIAALPIYVLLGALLWYAMLRSGVHSTVAGMITGLLVPMRAHGRNSPSPLNRAMARLHPFVSFGILPVFAFANAGIALHGMAMPQLLSPVPLGVALGLLIGKPVGIFSATWLSIKLKLADRPRGMGWGMLASVSLIAGIGFTMSLFISALAFPGTAERESATLGILGGSLAASLLGYGTLRWSIRMRE